VVERGRVYEGDSQVTDGEAFAARVEGGRWGCEESERDCGEG